MSQLFKDPKIISKKFNIDLIIGPLAYNYSKIKNLKKKFKFLNIIINKFDISIYLQRCKFAISTSSSVIYEFNSLYLSIFVTKSLTFLI